MSENIVRGIIGFTSGLVVFVLAIIRGIVVENTGAGMSVYLYIIMLVGFFAAIILLLWYWIIAPMAEENGNGQN